MAGKKYRTEPAESDGARDHGAEEIEDGRGMSHKRQLTQHCVHRKSVAVPSIARDANNCEALDERDRMA